MQRQERPINIGDNPELPEDSSEQSIETRPCGYCQRSFQVDRLKAHEKVCRKISNTPKRKVFDSSMKRIPSSSDLMGNSLSVVRGNLGFEGRGTVAKFGKTTENRRSQKNHGITPKPQHLKFSYRGSNRNERGVLGGFPHHHSHNNKPRQTGGMQGNRGFRGGMQHNFNSFAQQQNKLNIAHSNEPSMANPLKPNFARYVRSEQDYYN